MFLSPVPTLRRKKGTEKLDPISCAHAEAEEGYREFVPATCAHVEAEEGAQAEFVLSTARNSQFSTKDTKDQIGVEEATE